MRPAAERELTMPASLLSDEEVWRRADQFDAPMRRMLRRVGDQPSGILPRSIGITRSEEDALTRLTSFGMVDAGYVGTGIVPYRWELNPNGERALKYLDTPSTVHEEGPLPDEPEDG